ncbi:four-helix bundle copper-binding protein [Anabaena sp. WFMT]|uniref:four-helix bundle copper-binding protein n=1 Tax=Anabaena sp. WFMT TaxID=3449730 RepID=UPI003F28456D
MMMMMTETMTTEMQTCINACMECHKKCLETMTYCMSKGGKYMDMAMMSIMRDCSEMCMMCMNMMMGGSEFMGRTCMLCAEMCDRCAAACEKISDDNKMMECAAACRRCAETCRSMQMMPA